MARPWTFALVTLRIVRLRAALATDWFISRNRTPFGFEVGPRKTKAASGAALPGRTHAAIMSDIGINSLTGQRVAAEFAGPIGIFTKVKAGKQKILLISPSLGPDGGEPELVRPHPSFMATGS